MKAAKYILILSVIMLPFKAALADDPITVKTAVELKMIKLSAHGASPDSAAPYSYSGHVGKCIELVYTNLTNKNLTLMLETGRKFECDSDRTQDLMISHSHIFVLNAKQKATHTTYAFCVSPSKGSPGPKSTFKIKEMADGYLLQLVQLIERKNYQNSGGQSAIWAIINKSDSNIVSGGSDPVQRKAMKRFVAYAKRGLTITDAMLFEDEENIPVINKTEYYITGEIKWEMAKKGIASLCVYDEQGNYLTDIFVQKEYNEGNQSCNFKVTTCLIEPDKKYLVRVKVKDQTLEELACTGKQ
jgi:hypothetical protein